MEFSRAMSYKSTKANHYRGTMGQNHPLELSEEEKKELSIGLLREWWLVATQALVDNADSDTALNYFKPHLINAGKASVHVFVSLTGITSVRDFKMWQGSVLASMMDGVWGPGYVADDGSFIGELFDCGTEGSCKVACEAYCGIGACNAEEMDPSFEMSLISTLSEGDKSCQWLIAKRGKPPKVKPSKEFLTPPDIRIRTELILDEEAINSLVYAYLGEYWVIATKAFIEQAGSKKALDQLRSYIRHSGMSLGIRLFDRLNAHEKKRDSIVDLVSLIQELHQMKGEMKTQEGSNECEIIECPFSSSPTEICLQYEAFFNGICEAIDPSYEFKYDRMMTKGDKTCHWTIMKKGKDGKEKVKEEGSADDPIKRLTNKFIDGEITEEELEKKLAHLRKLGLVK
jgi:hypothetical protein